MPFFQKLWMHFQLWAYAVCPIHKTDKQLRFYAKRAKLVCLDCENH